MIQIRQNIFETNSSSVHTMTITDNDTYERWINGEITSDEVRKEVNKYIHSF